MVRVYRSARTGTTWIERGTGAPLIVVPDHGDPGYQWITPNMLDLVYDDELHASRGPHGENDHLTDARARLVKAVAESTIPATAKAEVRKIIGEVIK